MPRARLVAASLLVTLTSALAVRADVVDERSELYSSYSQRLDELADWCSQQKLDDAAAALKNWLPKREPDQLTLFLIPPAQLAAKNAPDATEWRRRWQSLRNDQADRLMALARRAVAERRASLSGELIVEALRENPDHELARAMLGYRRLDGVWRTGFETKQLRSGNVWHDKFGWLPQAHLARYERGERFAAGRWMSAAEEAELRKDLGRGWKVETEHYVVTTNHSLEEGVALAGRLEKLYAIWQQVFASYLLSETEMLRRFEGRATLRPARQHNVVYYRTRQEYVEALRAAQPKIEMTLGIYFDTTRTAYFFAGEEQNPGTLYHEAAHQLFQETRKVAPRVGSDHNFWIVEGIACYLESLTEHDGYFTLGGANSARMPAARHRLLVDGFYMPLAELVGLGMVELQSDERIAMLYSQSAGLADFFMHDERGRYRDALARYLVAVYSGRAAERTLAETTGQSYDTLDRQYRAFMSQGESVASQNPR
jgi:hypothetical protein